MNASDNRTTEDEELSILMGRITGIQQVTLSRIPDRPVNVLTRTVDTSERLLMQQTHKAVLLRRMTQGRHDQLLMVAGHVCRFKDRSNFKLTWRYLVVTSLRRNSQLIQGLFYILHKDLNALRNGTKVVIIKFLTLSRSPAKQSTTRQ